MPLAGIPARLWGALPLLAAAIVLPGLSVAETSLTRIEVLDSHHSSAVQLFLEGPSPAAQLRVLDDPPRLVVELPWVADRTGGRKIEVRGRRVERVSVLQSHPSRLEIVIEPARIEDPFQGRGLAPFVGGLMVTAGSGPIVALEGGTAGPEEVAARPTEGSAEARPPPPVEPPAVAAAPVWEPAEGSPEPLRSDGLRFLVTDFAIEYGKVHPDLPPTDDLRRVAIDLGVTSQGYVAPREGVPIESVRLLDVRNAPRQYFYGSAIRAINERLVAELNRRGLQGVLVLPHEGDIEPRASRDLRPSERTALRLVIWTGRLLEYRTFASGSRIPEEARVDHPLHRRLKERSPVQPGDLLRRDELDAYVARLNRHPGRSVDTALSAAQEPGGVYLDFLVAEARPLRAYVQGSNTGTSSTTEWRQRFGFVHTQVSNRDDVLRLDYITGAFDEVNAAFGSYEVPVWKWDRLRANVGGSWSKYDASEFGFVVSKFDGEQWDVGAQAIFTLIQAENLFVDVFGGARFQRIDVKNKPIPGFPPSQGDGNFFLPEVGVRVERTDPYSNLRGALWSVFNVAAIAGTSKADVNSLGRNFVSDKNFEILYWDLSASAYLEPLLNPSGFQDSSTPFTSTLAHEIALNTQGQHSFDNRLTPQFQGIAGGLRTVRGYNQSIVAGDTAVLGRAEYRLHLPRLLPVRPAPETLPWIGSFRLARQEVHGVPDWDLILRAFFDFGRTSVEGNIAGESIETLMSVGPGIELRILDHLTLAFDYGVALRDVRGGQAAKSGSHEFHFSGSLIY